MERTHLRAMNCAKILVRALIPEGDDLNMELIQLYECSRSASFEKKIKEGGGREWVRELIDAGGLGSEYPEFVEKYLRPDYLSMMDFHPRVGTYSGRTDCPSLFKPKELLALDLDRKFSAEN